MVNAIPEGVGAVVPYLCIRGAKKAIEFYKAAFGAEVMSVMPMGKDLIGHADLKIGGARVYLADEMPGWGAVRSPKELKGTSANIHLWVQDCDAAFAKAVSVGAKVLMPLTDQFWGDRYGMVSDPFGHVWAISTHKEDLTPEETMRRGEAAMAQMAASAPPSTAKPKSRRKKAKKQTVQPKAPATPARKASAKSKSKTAAPAQVTEQAQVEKAKGKKEVKAEKKVRPEKKGKKQKKSKKSKAEKKSKPEKKSKRDKKRKKKSKR